MEHTLLQWAHQLGTLEYWQTLLDRFGDLGPLAPITLAVVESFFPPLPLIAIVALNVGAHGGILGFLYSWIGVAGVSDRLGCAAAAGASGAGRLHRRGHPRTRLCALRRRSTERLTGSSPFFQ